MRLAPFWHQADTRGLILFRQLCVALQKKKKINIKKTLVFQALRAMIVVGLTHHIGIVQST
jgi:hypothetical protein